MTAKYSQTLTLSVPYDTVFATTRSVIESSIAKLKSADPSTGKLEATVGASIFSWGELITVDVTQNGASTDVTIRSKSRMPLTLLDYGRNKRNVEAITTKLQSQLSATPSVNYHV